MLRAGLVGGRRAAFLVRAWGVGVVRGAGRRGSVACGVAQRAKPVLLDLYLRFCILDVFLMNFSCSCLCACVLPYMA